MGNAYPVPEFPNLQRMRFLCDEMMVRLARLLRAAGYDAALAQGGASDAALLAQAKAEDRIIVTRDRTLAQLAAPNSALIATQGTGGEAEALAAQVPIDWTLAPFTRCVMDNAPLRPATAEEIARMPPQAQRMAGPFRACPACGRLYWPGSHVRRMAARLSRLAGVEGAGDAA